MLANYYWYRTPLKEKYKAVVNASGIPSRSANINEKMRSFIFIVFVALPSVRIVLNYV